MARKAAAVLLILAALVAGAAGFLRHRAHQAPAWWSPPDPRLDETARLAERVEYRMAEVASTVRPEAEPWAVRVKEGQVNAWLAARLPEWLAHAGGAGWPAGLSAPQVRVKSGHLTVGVEVRDGDQRRYLSADFAPRIADGGLVLGLTGVSLGRLRIPGGSIRTVLERIERVEPGFLEDPTVAGIIDLVLDERRLDPVVTLHDGRTVQVLDVTCEAGAVVLRCRTLPD